MKASVEIAAQLRRDIFQAIEAAGGGHIAPAFSLVEILTVLYWDMLNVDPKYPEDPRA